MINSERSVKSRPREIHGSISPQYCLQQCVDQEHPKPGIMSVCLTALPPYKDLFNCFWHLCGYLAPTTSHEKGVPPLAYMLHKEMPSFSCLVLPPLSLILYSLELIFKKKKKKGALPRLFTITTCDSNDLGHNLSQLLLSQLFRAKI